MGVTQEQLADCCGLSVRAIRDIEAGRVARPRLDTVRRLADGLVVVDEERQRFFDAASPTAEREPSDLLAYLCSGTLGALEEILAGHRLPGSPPPGADPDQPAVCFFELSRLPAGVRPWGVLFTRDWVMDHGGEQVSYMGPDRWSRRRREDKPWAALIGTGGPAPGHEWRILVPPDDPYLPVPLDAMAAILTGEPTGALPATVVPPHPPWDPAGAERVIRRVRAA